ncbi:Heterokaryon incompatibility protein (HET) domain containing protein [Hyaloscypha variabilis]
MLDSSYARDLGPADSSGRFQHKPLKHNNSFRLLRIHPTVLGSRPLKCDVISVQSPDLVPSYYAISYRWEKTSKSGKIFINAQEFPVYPNVESILKDMRSPFRPLLVWIDQVCISQEDRAEQAKQVAMMGEIYNSLCVIVCLHCPDIHLYGIFSVGRYIFSHFSSEESAKMKHYLAIGNWAHWQSLGNLLSHPWFGRVWIIQEIALAKHVSLRYGNMDLNWGNFIVAMEYVKAWENLLTAYDNQRDMAMKSKEAAEKAESSYRHLMALGSEELMFTHLLSTDLSKSVRRHGGDISSVLDRSFNITHLQDPRVSTARQFAITEKGYMGLVPVLSEVGDVVVILHGATTPHLLRPCPQTTNAGGVTYRLVGEAYMHGLMRGHLDISYGYPQQEFLLV